MVCFLVTQAIGSLAMIDEAVSVAFRQLDIAVITGKRSLGQAGHIFDKGTGVKTDATPESVRVRYQGAVCVCCGTSENVSCVHLVKTAEMCKNLNLRFDSTNFIPLCGAEGQLDTCHHKFDFHLLTLQQIEQGNTRKWRILGGGMAPNGINLHGREVTTPCPLSRRVMKAHLCEALYAAKFVLPDVLDMDALSETPPEETGPEGQKGPNSTFGDGKGRKEAAKRGKAQMKAKE
eukprot:1466106-Amphidinium_carterae.1